MKNKLKFISLLSILLLLLYCGSTNKSLEVPQPPVVVTVATYNLQDFTDGLDDPNTPLDQGRRKSQKSVDALGEIFQAMNADIIAVEEVEWKDLLTDFCSKYLPETQFFISFFRSWDPSGINVGLLTKYPITDEKLIDDILLKDPDGKTMIFNYGYLEGKPIPFSRGILKVRVKIKNNQEVTFFIVHFKAGWSEQSPERRIAESTAIRQVVRQLYNENKEVDFVILGDFNDTPRSKPVKLLEGLDTDMPIKDVFDLEPEKVSNKIRASHPSRNPYRPIDHIFVSPGMVENYVQGSAKVFRHPKESDASDHLPVICQFKFN